MRIEEIKERRKQIENEFKLIKEKEKLEELEEKLRLEKEGLLMKGGRKIIKELFG